MTTITSKAYTAKSSATRAAKKDYSNELANGSAIIKQLDDGMWVYEVTPVEAKERDLSPAAKELTDAIKENKKAKRKTRDTDNAEHLGIDGLENLDQDIKEGNFSRVSEIESPCVKVWAIAEAMQGERRKDIIAACVDHGVAYYTARTQYQHWFTAKKNDQAAAERAAAKKAAK